MTPRLRSSANTRLAQLRQERGITQAALAEAIGVSRQTYTQLELGEAPRRQLRYLANAAILLGCEIEDLIEDSERGWSNINGRVPAPAPHRRLWHKA